MMSRQKRVRRIRRAFTLLEVLMVVAIIGLLAAFVVPNLFGRREAAQVSLVQSTVDRGLNGALDLYKVDMGRYPREDDGGLMALYEQPDDDEEAKKWHGPYVKKADDLKDSWGIDYIYECPGTYNENSYDLSSAGPDRESGTEDDIKNWTEE
ncbi:MAG: type II secretion system major pseudopilin GspG [Phycisphaerae bacterium]|jgi:general secretion pathway protein G